MENFIERQRKLYPLSGEAANLFLEETEEIVVAKGERILTAGKRTDFVYFVKEGLARVYIEREEKDTTLWFTGAGEMLAGASATASPLNAEMMENGSLLKISGQRLEALFGRSLELANWGRKLCEHYLAEYEHYFTYYSGTDAYAQYERLLREYPELIRKVPLKHIASYLQITPQSLSRIRAYKK